MVISVGPISVNGGGCFQRMCGRFLSLVVIVFKRCVWSISVNGGG